MVVSLFLWGTTNSGSGNASNFFICSWETLPSTQLVFHFVALLVIPLDSLGALQFESSFSILSVSFLTPNLIPPVTIPTSSMLLKKYIIFPLSKEIQVSLLEIVSFPSLSGSLDCGVTGFLLG